MPRHHARRSRAAALALAVVTATVGLLLPASPSYAATAPTITGLSVARGTTAGGTTLIITGTGFSTVNPADATSVLFGSGNATSFQVVSDTQISAVSPAGTGAADTGVVDLRVKNPTGTSAITTKDRFAYREPITASVASGTLMNPIAGSVLTVTSSYTFSGATGFSLERITATVGGTNATIAYIDTTHIRVTVPAGTPSNTPAPVAILHDGIVGTASTNAKYAAVISALSRKVGPVAGGGGNITVTGKGLSGATSWLFGTEAATCSVVSDTSATCTGIPSLSTPGTGAVAVSFTPASSTPFGYTAGGSYLYTNLT